MKINETELPEVLTIKPEVFRDHRGAFCETLNDKTMATSGIPSKWVQDNFSISKKNVIRGIHYQIDQPQGKLVRVTHGAVIDVVVDLRKTSPTFAKHIAVELSDENATMLWIPKGFGHGFLALTDDVGFAYKVTDYYSPAGERTLLWNDSDLAIQWPIATTEIVVSIKDSQGKPLREAELFD